MNSINKDKAFTSRPVFRALLIAVLTALSYLPILQNGFIESWDDDRYILENRFIEELSLERTAEIFTIYYDGHYHPLTLISLAVDHAIAGDSPKAYHLVNLLIHLLNALLVFFFVHLLLRRQKLFIAGMTGLLFGLATVHVESVAWAAERKNLLYTSFFLASLISYLSYIREGKKSRYLLSLLLFLLSLLSKASALSLAPTLLLLDYFENRRLLSRRVLSEKIPFFLLAIAAGVVAVYAQKHTWGEDLSQDHYSFFERVLYASIAFILYISKLAFPFRLSAFYPYPSLPVVAGILCLLLSISVAAIAFYYRRRSRVISFGILFFIINIIMLLKLFEVPAGDYYMADRYVYAASPGILLIISIGIEKLLSYRRKFGKLLLVPVIIYLLLIFLQTFNRVSVWRSDEPFYSDIIDKHPRESVAYLNRGAYRKKTGNLRGALHDFTAAVEFRPGDFKGYANRGAVYNELRQYDKALQDLEKAAGLKPGSAEIMGNLGFAKLNSGLYREAVQDFNRAIGLDPGLAENYLNLGTAWFSLGNLRAAIENYNLALERKPDYVNALYNRGLARINLNLPGKARSDLTRVLELDPRHADAYMNRAVTWSKAGDFDRAFADYARALEINPRFAEVYLNRGIDRYHLRDYEAALEDLNKALEINRNIPACYYFRGMALIRLDRISEGCAELKIAADAGFRLANDKLTTLCR